MDIKLIVTDTDYKEALAEIERLWSAELGSLDEAKLELLAMLVHNYERSREPLPPLDPVDAIKFRMEQRGLSRKDLLRVFGTTARVSEVLGHKRALTLEMIRKLHSLFDIPLESLIGPALRPPAKKKRRAPNDGARNRVTR
jgi:HTH-type transcriptional regulator/antitoxin HigA